MRGSVTAQLHASTLVHVGFCSFQCEIQLCECTLRQFETPTHAMSGCARLQALSVFSVASCVDLHCWGGPCAHGSLQRCSALGCAMDMFSTCLYHDLDVKKTKQNASSPSRCYKLVWNPIQTPDLFTHGCFELVVMPYRCSKLLLDVAVWPHTCSKLLLELVFPIK